MVIILIITKTRRVNGDISCTDKANEEEIKYPKS